MGASGDWLFEMKASCFASGIRVTDRAVAALTEGGTVPLTIHEYATTGGVTFEAPGGVFVNAPFDEPYCARPEAELDVDDGRAVVRFRGDEVPVRVLPLPGYLGENASDGRALRDVVMSHADRVRLSPIRGCSFSCDFCDFAGMRYVRHDVEELVRALRVAADDPRLPMRHVLVSGGTPLPRDDRWFEEVCSAVARDARVPVDVMMTPRADAGMVDHLCDAGVHGFALNLELFDADAARRYAPQKAKLGRETFARSISRAVERTGGKGRVRSLLVAGLEPMEGTLAGVEFLARLGCDPVLSPFRPVRGTRLVDHPAPSLGFLRTLHARAKEVAEAYGVKLGPRCIPCQHNTLTVPDGSGAYAYS